MPVQTIMVMPGDEVHVICGAADASAASGAAKRGRNNVVYKATAPNLEMNGGKKTRSAKKMGGGKTRKMSGYFKFMQEERSNIVKQHPKFAVTDVAKEAGKRWRSLSAAEKAKY
jgi:HMG (high mobility group) box